ncbi:flavin-containing monooxygenase [Streptomyces candidus]|uniref:Putative flavoprotein involved in K+ transport n=1 Tax=Streptomyces candidus TaxID=67283 RepID=A0A7X0LNJ7_9ACTN|nr:NAD(P)/FAD-dependent oxidoreductase [Streptomyces candidus]MBB6435538.1 putative flavoprotein involved in K+ transport [Streptomyces candidus]GHH47075.1 monooxygenase [Streptomyces candidus]
MPPNAPRPSAASAITTTNDRPVYVIGGGPGGLATAAALRTRGVRAVVLEKSDQVGASWRNHYDCLQLHTTRTLSALPGLRMPRSFGRWVSRDNVVRYLEKYVEHHELEIVTGVEVARVDPAADGTGWVLHASGGRELTGAAVVVATGYNHTPHLPGWPGRSAYPGELIHAAAYRDPTPYRGKDVLVVGTGNTGTDIAVDLAKGGASRVRLAVRTPPYVLRRTTAGWPAQRTAVLVRHLPAGLVDRIGDVLVRVSVPDLSAHGLPRATGGVYTRVHEGAIPVQDVGIVAAVRAGKVEPVAALTSFDPATGEAVLSDGTRLAPEAVVAATGYRRALEGLVGHLGVLDARGRPTVHGARTAPGAPGLHFTGFTNPISGMLREMARDADRIARTVERSRTRART